MWLVLYSLVGLKICDWKTNYISLIRACIVLITLIACSLGSVILCVDIFALVVSFISPMLTCHVFFVTYRRRIWGQPIWACNVHVTFPMLFTGLMLIWEAVISVTLLHQLLETFYFLVWCEYRWRSLSCLGVNECSVVCICLNECKPIGTLRKFISCFTLKSLVGFGIAVFLKKLKKRHFFKVKHEIIKFTHIK